MFEALRGVPGQGVRWWRRCCRRGQVTCLASLPRPPTGPHRGLSADCAASKARLSPAAARPGKQKQVITVNLSRLLHNSHPVCVVGRQDGAGEGLQHDVARHLERQVHPLPEVPQPQQRLPPHRVHNPSFLLSSSYKFLPSH